MKKFVIQAIFFTLIILGVSWAICPYYVSIHDNSVSATIVDKTKLIEAQCDKPRIIFLGGSSVAMSNDSYLIANALDNKYKPVNMGLCAALGLDFILDTALPDIRKGDLVVLSIEYQLFKDLTRPGRVDFISDVVMYDKKILAKLSFHQLQNLCDQSLYIYMRRFQRKIKDYKKARKIKTQDLPDKSRWKQLWTLHNAVKIPKSPFVRTGFNDAGDMLSHLDLPRTIDDNIIVFEGPINKREWQKSIDKINTFTENCRKKGANVVFFMTMISEYNYKTAPELFDTFADYFQSHAMPKLLNRPDESLVKDDHFFNTNYHLNREGRRIRSELLARKLRAFLGER